MTKNTLAGLLILLSGAVAVVGGGVFAPPLPPTVIGSIGIWNTLSVLSNLLAPAFGAVTTYLVWLHKRLNELEESQNELDTSVYGHDKDDLNSGVLLEVRNINKRLDDIQSSIEELRRENEQLKRDVYEENDD